MKKRNISKTLFIVISLIFLVNAIISISNLFESNTLLLRVIPAVCWSIATIIWIIVYLKKAKSEKEQKP